MRHVPAHRLAALCRDALPKGELAKARAHIADCDRCQSQLERIASGQSAMRDIARQGGPELGWDHIAARVYWSTSSERRLKTRHARPAWVLPVAGSISAAAIAAAALWAWKANPGSARSAAESSAGVIAPGDVRVAETVAPQEQTSSLSELTGVLSFAQGEVKIDGADLDFDQLLQVGATLKTGSGRAVVQFGEQSAFRVAEQSLLRIRRFDRARIELHIDGVVDVDITRRLNGQEFVVVAGGHEVLVRGTAFRVEHRDGEIGVSCTRGEVVVTDGEDRVRVPAGQAFRVLSSAWQQAALRSLPIDSQELRNLDRAMQMPMLPSWDQTRPLRGYESVIEVQASPDQLIAVDGVTISSGSFTLRSPGGRHQLATVDEQGELGSVQWLELGESQRGEARIAPPEAPAAGRRSAALRRNQMRTQLGKRADACLKPLAKKGLVQGSYLVFDVGINADGSHSYLNVRDSNLSPMIQRCFRDALDAGELPAGPEASFRLKLSY